MNEIFMYTKGTKKTLEDADKFVTEMLEERQTGNRICNNEEAVNMVHKYCDYRFPEEKISLEEYMESFRDNIIPDMMNTASPKFIGHMTSALPVALPVLSKAVTGLNQNVVKMETSKGLTMLERELLAMMHRQLFQREDAFYEQNIQSISGSLGNLTADGTIANLTALWVARNLAFPKDNEFQGVEREGMLHALLHYNMSDAVIIGSEQMHYSFEKAADILGIGAGNLIKIPCDENGRIRIDKFEKKIIELKEKKICIIAAVGIAGTTNMGSIDPLAQMADICMKYQIYFHVDAAWGGTVVLSEKYRRLLDGIEKANSVTVDAHKQMYLPVGLGMVFFREMDYVKAIEKNANYIIRKNSYDLGQYSLEGSRTGNSILLHAAVRLISRRGYEELINHNIDMMHEMYVLLKSNSCFEVYTEPQLNIILYRYIPERMRMQKLTGEMVEKINELNIALQRMQRKKGDSFVSRTTINGNAINQAVVFLRAVILNPLTTMKDIKDIIKEQCELGEWLESRMVF